MRKFIINISLFFLPVALLLMNYMLLLVFRENVGDLATLGKIFYEKGYHEKFKIDDSARCFVCDVPIDKIPESAVAVCFGDSFSRQSHSYLQNVGQSLGEIVYNVTFSGDKSPEDAALSFLESDIHPKPEYLIVESCERYCIPRLYWLDFDNVATIKEIRDNEEKTDKRKNVIKSFSNNFVAYYRRKVGIDDDKVLVSRLDRRFFTAEDKEDLLISYFEDTIHYSPQYIDGATQKLGQLNDMAKKQGVALFYLVAPNKSTLYAPYVKGDVIFSVLLRNNSPFDTIPYVFNPLKVLGPDVDNGQKDIYYSDDSHWTPQTANIVGTEFGNVIKERSEKTF